MNYLELFFVFWFWKGPKSMLSFDASLNKAFLQLFSVSLLIKTFFKPWKNEYREGLVGFSIVMGIVIKTIFLSITMVLFLILLTLEVFLFIAFIVWPLVTVLLLLI